MRGVHIFCDEAMQRVVGSSPHARGPHRQARSVGDPHGFIPACAGSTEAPFGERPCNRVHPRMRGVHKSSLSSWMTYSGSSPHARGPHPLAVLDVCIHRFIPACAGSTPDIVHTGLAVVVHPRMRGVHLWSLEDAGSYTGSSPHARGPLPGTG